jgi:hypothetical protein
MCTKAFLKGWNSGLCVNFGKFPISLLPDPDPHSLYGSGDPNQPDPQAAAQFDQNV